MYYATSAPTHLTHKHHRKISPEYLWNIHEKYLSKSCIRAILRCNIIKHRWLPRKGIQVLPGSTTYQGHTYGIFLFQPVNPRTNEQVKHNTYNTRYTNRLVNRLPMFFIYVILFSLFKPTWKCQNLSQRERKTVELARSLVTQWYGA